MSLVVAIADAVAAQLLGSELALGTVQRRVLPRFEAAELTGLRTTVVPRSVEITGRSRALAQHDVQVDIGIQRRLAPGSQDIDAQVAALCGLVDQVIAHLRRRPLAGRPDAAWVQTANEPVYASFGVGDLRDWDEARKYGFISAGGGTWYSRTLGMLEPGGRVWVNIPGVGYVGVGEVVESVVPIDDFMADDGTGKRVPIASLPLKAAKHVTLAADADKAEHFVRINWRHTVPMDQAIREKGLFGNQNSAAKPRAKKWHHTVERLAAAFGEHL